MSDNTPSAVPLIEMLRSIPLTARLIIEEDWKSSTSWPVGTLSHDAANEIARLRAEVADLQCSVIAFGFTAMVKYARDCGLPKGHLYPTHYDILQRAGARMDDFIRVEVEKAP